MPGVHKELQACGSHRQKFGNNEFFELFTLDKATRQKVMVNEPGEQLPVLVKESGFDLLRINFAR